MTTEAKQPMGCSEFVLWVLGWIFVPWLAFIVLLCVNKAVRDVVGVMVLIILLLFIIVAVSP